MGKRRIRDIGEMPLLLGPKDCARLLGLSYEAFNLRRRAGDFPPPFNTYGVAQWHRDTVEAYLRGKRKRVVA